jgi:hypothetical protein
MLTKGFVAADGPERIQWQKEDADESRRDTNWNRRYGPIPAGASIVPWRNESEDSAAYSVSAKRFGK